MAAKAFFVICAQALLIQMSLAQVSFPGSKLSGNYGFGSTSFGRSGLIGSGLTSGSSATSNLVTGTNIVSGGPLLVTAISPIGPSGLAVASENAIDGILTVNGQLPYLSAVAFDGSLPTAGSGTASCGCGSASVGMVSEGLSNKAGRWY